MVRLVPYQESMRAEWDSFALRHGTVYHTTGFRRILLESFGYRCAYQAALDRQQRLCGIVPLVVGRSLTLARTGVSLPFANQLDFCAATAGTAADMLAELPALKQSLGLDCLEIRLKDQTADRQRWGVCRENHTFVLELRETESATLAQASSDCRNHVRKTYKNAWFESSLAPERLAEFYEVYVRRMKELGSPAPSFTFFQAFFRHLPEQSELLTVLDPADQRVVGGMLLLKSPGDATLYYPFGASLIEYNRRHLNNFMYWEAVRLGIRLGFARLDLGRSPTGSGTYRFKQQWGAKPVQLTYLRLDAADGDWTGDTRRRLGPLIELWRQLPRCVTDPVGQRVIGHLFP